MSDIFGKVAGATASVSGVYIKPGSYTLELLNLEAGRKTNGSFFIAEFQVLESQKTDPNHEPNAVGSRCSYVVNLDKIAGPGSVKAMFLSLFGETDETIANEDLGKAMKAACSPEQPFRYFKLKDVAFEKPQKGDKTKMFTHHRWEHVEPTDVEVKAIRQRQKESAKA